MTRSRPRVLWVSTSPETRGGIGAYVRTMRSTTLWRDWDVRHVTTHRDGSTAARIATFGTGLVRVCAALVRRPAAVHLHTASYGSFVRKASLTWIARAARVPVVLHVHGGEFVRFHDRCPAPARAVIRATLHTADTVVALGDRWAARLGEVAPRARILVVPNAVRIPEQPSRTAGTGGVHVVAVGDVSDAKGTFVLLDAWAKLTAELPPATARLTIAGAGEVDRARAAVTELGIGDSVEVTDWIRPGAVADLLASAAVLALPSRAEGQPMAVLEAMAHGLAVVATDVGGIPDLVGPEQGILVPRDDREALTDALRDVVTDDARRTAMGAAALAAVRDRFDVDVVVARLDALYRRVTGREPTVRAAAAPSRPLVLTVVLDRTGFGGAEIVLLETVRHLDPARVRARLVCLRDGGALADDFRAAGAEVEVLERNGRYDLSTLPKLVSGLRRSGTDAVLVTHHHRASLLLGRIAARLTGAVSLVAVHNMDLVAQGGRCLPRSTVETLALSQALVLLSQSQGEYLHREEGVGSRPWRRTREAVVRNGITIGPAPTAADRAWARAELGLGDDDEVVMIVARLYPEKAHEVLFAAIAELLPSRPRLRLVVVGDGARRPELEALAGRLGIAGITTFTGVRRDVRKLLPAIDVSALSSTHEAAPLVLLEAMAAAKPIVSTDCGAVADLVSDGTDGHLVPIGDHIAMADRIGRILADPVLRDAMGAAAYDHAVREHRIETTADDLTALVEDLSGDPRPREHMR
ncbi:glycosyltransferase [Pseudonocardia sp. N23]|uniref:glycosyltransferase family 4 protein n=1 Tax=Pseudonocardia sp. N23 TaxID=1987376 RepID=UPI000BFB67A2|nr:glycosyltransferase [Pseudonocardia sp. N23]GAY12248.1 glycosyltransferase [Pseudonocardia sp. N23]